MVIQLENPATPDVVRLLEEHLADMASHSPPESVHALDITALQHPDVRFFTCRNDDILLGCGAYMKFGIESAEIKSMKTATAYLRQGVAARLLEHIVTASRQEGITRLYLETGSPDAFLPARKLYERYGFVEVPPFGDYRPDPYSVFMCLESG